MKYATMQPITQYPALFRLRYIFALAARVLGGDTLAIRVLMASASIVFALAVTIHPDTFERKAFSGMGLFVWQFGWEWLSPSVFWGSLFVAHGLGVFWRIYEVKSRIYWAVAINWLGFLLWAAEFALTNLALGEFAAGNALELPAIIALLVALIRTGRGDDKFTP